MQQKRYIMLVFSFFLLSFSCVYSAQRQRYYSLREQQELTELFKEIQKYSHENNEFCGLPAPDSLSSNQLLAMLAATGLGAIILGSWVIIDCCYIRRNYIPCASSSGEGEGTGWWPSGK